MNTFIYSYYTYDIRTLLDRRQSKHTAPFIPPPFPMSLYLYCHVSYLFFNRKRKKKSNLKRKKKGYEVVNIYCDKEIRW